MNKRNYLKFLSVMVLGLGLATNALAADTPANLKGATLVSAAEVKAMLEKGLYAVLCGT